MREGVGPAVHSEVNQAEEEDRMGRREEHTELHRRFRSLLSPQRVARAARKTGFVVRKGKMQTRAPVDPEAENLEEARLGDEIERTLEEMEH